jgi:hypothetical protein
LLKEQPFHHKTSHFRPKAPRAAISFLALPFHSKI